MTSISFNKTTVPVGQSFVNVGVGPGALTTLVAPASNPSGLIIRTLSINSGGGTGAIYTSATAPSSASDLTTRIVFQFSSASAGDSQTVPHELYVYPGMGVYIGNSHPTGNVILFMTYDNVLPDQVS